MPSPVTRQQFDAVLFDLDGVLTTTLAVHAAAWKRTLDEFLCTWNARHGTTSSPFDERSDYATYVDGKPRQDGVRAFLTARGIQISKGSPDSGPEEKSVWGLATASNWWSRTSSSGPGSRPSRGRWPGCGAARGGPEDRGRLQQPQLRRRAGVRGHREPHRHPGGRRDRAGPAPGGQASARCLPGGGSAASPQARQWTSSAPVSSTAPGVGVPAVGVGDDRDAVDRRHLPDLGLTSRGCLRHVDARLTPVSQAAPVGSRQNAAAAGAGKASLAPVRSCRDPWHN
jgi:hypothetical protein